LLNFYQRLYLNKYLLSLKIFDIIIMSKGKRKVKASKKLFKKNKKPIDKQKNLCYNKYIR